uniref:Uncharacterized protein n=1 Tax=Leptobrachium leishanense TaxID=445787 RepID=A0A8C5QKB3_9ANUR
MAADKPSSNEAATGSCRFQPINLTSFGNKEIKSRWNWGSITCIICFTWVGSQLSISSSKASSFSGPLHIRASFHNPMNQLDGRFNRYNNIFLFTKRNT